MEGDSIYQGDFVIINPKIAIKNHDIVVVSLPDHSLLIKHFYKKGRYLYFYPFGLSQDRSGRLLDQATIIGKVVAIISKQKTQS